MADEHAILKGIETELKKNRKNISALVGQKNKLKTERDKEVSKISKEINEIERKVKELENKRKILTSDVVITEHAILRYLERVKGVDIEAIKKEILPDYTLGYILGVGMNSGKYPAGTHKVVLSGNIITTVIND